MVQGTDQWKELNTDYETIIKQICGTSEIQQSKKNKCF